MPGSPGGSGLRADVRRVPLFGLGCVAGAAGVARLHDYLRGAPDDVAALISVELCSLTYPGYKPSVAGLVGSALFADGAAAVVAVGERRAEQIGAERARASSIRAATSTPTRCAPWATTSAPPGFELVLSKDLATVVEQYIGAGRQHVPGRARADKPPTSVRGSPTPAAPRSSRRSTESLDLPPEALELTWRSLGEIGNLSSASVLHVLRDTIAKPPPSDSPGLMIAMGPGFCSELVLLRWH